MKKELALGIAVALFVPVSAARAQLIAYEPFAYTSGQALIGQPNGGSGFSAGWVAGPSGQGPGTGTIAPGSLTPAAPSSGLTTSGNSMTASASSGGFYEAQRFLATAVPGTVGTTLWMSVVMKGTGASGSTSQGVLIFGDTSGNGFSITTGAVGFGIAPNNPPPSSTWSLGDGGNGSSEATSNVSNSLQSLLVARATLGSTTDTVDLFVNPPLTGTAPAVPNATETVPHTDSYTRIDAFYSTLGTSTTSTLFDEIRLGGTFADVTPSPVPEPSSLVLVGIAGIGWFARRRR